MHLFKKKKRLTILLCYLFPRVARFSDVQHLSIHFPSNHGNSDNTEVYYIGLKGDYTEVGRSVKI